MGHTHNAHINAYTHIRERWVGRTLSVVHSIVESAQI